MDKNPLLRKCLVAGIILLFIGLTHTPNINANNPISNHITSATYKSNITLNNGTLSGHVTDSEDNPIEGARVRVYFHDTYSENYSDSTGYFHVTNISICNCTKNATCSKEGYNSVWVYLGIWYNTTYDFVLTSKGDWLYVGGSGPGNYTRIQDAVDNASDGDTVYVYRGIYSDYLPEYSTGVFISKDINLLGENKYSTVINGSVGWRSVVNIMTDGVCINGFAIQNCKGGIAAVLIEDPTGLSDIKDITIYDTIIRENTVGISCLSNISNSMFYNNILSNNTYGIELIHCNNCSVYKNHISNNMIGIVLESIKSNIIEYNLILENGIGIEALTSHGTIVFNNFINNEKHAYFENWFTNTLFLIIPLLLYYKQYWNSNYWDDWNTTNPRPIQGEWMVVFAIGDLHFLFGSFPSAQFDRHPVQEPYDIPSTS